MYNLGIGKVVLTNAEKTHIWLYENNIMYKQNYYKQSE